MESKRVKLEEEKEDRISDLPDAIIQRILSFLPSTKEAIHTGILSKRWKNLWTGVPVLIFPFDCMFYEKVHKFIARTLNLHDCSKIKKFHLNYPYMDECNRQISSIISFATKRDVEDLDLNFVTHGYVLPKFLFSNASLEKLRIYGCTFITNAKVNWRCLTVLNIRNCVLTHQTMEHILSGSPLLESLELGSCSGFDKIVIASKSLKRLDLQRFCWDYISVQISCPNLLELSLWNITTNDPKLMAQMIENVLSGSPLLESIELANCRQLDQLVIASKSLKRLVVQKNSCAFDHIEISCPKLEELKIFDGLNVKTAKLINFPSSLCATLDFNVSVWDIQTVKCLIIEILQQLHHVNELKIGSNFMEVLSTMKVEGRFSPVLNTKCLTLHFPRLKKHYPRITYLLRISPLLEKLVINVPLLAKVNYKLGNNYWNSNAAIFDCLASHLKIIKIITFDFPKTDIIRQHVINFVQFLLNNARGLEKMIVVVKDGGTNSPCEIYQELLRLSRCSKNVIVELV